MDVSSQAAETHVGADPAPNTRQITADGDDRLLGFILNAVPAGNTITATFTTLRRIQILCLVASELTASNWNMISLKVRDSEKINQAGVTVTGLGAGTVQDTGVNLSMMTPFATCADVISGACLKEGSFVTIQAVNRSGAASGLAMVMRGRTFKADTEDC